MILADKIITLRKKAGWSQEELASQLGVTRQSVSKWEGAQSVPDLDKVVQMSRLFGVSTDYLLKDELEEEEFVESEAYKTPLRRVTMEQAARYLALRKACAPKIALAVAMCIVSSFWCWSPLRWGCFSRAGRRRRNSTFLKKSRLRPSTA